MAMLMAARAAQSPVARRDAASVAEKEQGGGVGRLARDVAAARRERYARVLDQIPHFEETCETMLSIPDRAQRLAYIWREVSRPLSGQHAASDAAWRRRALCVSHAGARRASTRPWRRFWAPRRRPRRTLPFRAVRASQTASRAEVTVPRTLTPLSFGRWATSSAS